MQNNVQKVTVFHMTIGGITSTKKKERKKIDGPWVASLCYNVTMCDKIKIIIITNNSNNNN